MLLLITWTPAFGQSGDADRRLDKLEAQATALQREIEQLRKELRAPTRAARPAQSDGSTIAATTVHPAEAAYMAGYSFWEQRRFREAQRSLEAVVKKYPKHHRASYARNLAGRAYLDGGQPATAAKLFLENYTADRDGERAPDSLFYLGQALMKMGKPADACRAYNELTKAYGNSLRAFLAEKLPMARAAARCT
jgi:TolA-binding protein